ncbi:SH3 domain-containing kinase-binding protein 1 [Rhinichthys klamathensis goyatoka]|uniref:SH3 domain-containing kinase-binding protein 1 n=1 Tax=Rhinichthys klamathensis goyatoka TaxID=3034132 RepID=UPI0024B62C03|nr:SH3 domain-containing kinase-binding protein 1 [Rhinichthys klamathensis goyatoka]XP_056118248.1 SH3 domain-containing kinase-binding protein 1 [Rhinichthys klamathensis goyatoka]
MGNYNAALTADIEDFKSIVSTLENQRILSEHNRLGNTLSVNHAVEEQAGQEMNEVNQEPDLLALKFLYNTDEPKDTKEPVSNCTSAPALAVSSSSSSDTTSTISLPAYLSALLAAKPRPALQGPATLEQMRAELRDLRDELDTLRTQQKKEIKLLMNELDEEKKMRLSLQIEVEHLKKHMSK